MLEVGSPGQFDVLVDGETVASRKTASFLARLFGGGWPDPRGVVDAIRARQTSSSKG